MATFTVGRNGFTNLDDNYNGLPVRVWGTTGTVADVRVTLTGLSHDWPDDLDLVLIGPGNTNLVFMSDAGAGGATPISNVNLTFFDGATRDLPDSSRITSGSYRPGAHEAGSDFVGINLPPLNQAAPTGGSTFASAFNGISPNGAWTLGASDDVVDIPGNLDTWSLRVKTSSNTVVLEDPVSSGEGADIITVSSTGAKSGSYTHNGVNIVTFSGVTKIVINGQDGNDTLTGGYGDDRLNGDADKDFLTGGKGRDVLSGGADKDFFDFNSINDSLPGSQRDRILDLKHGQNDKIDLEDIDAKTGVSGNNKFSFIGKDDFSETKGELRYEDRGSKVIVQGDRNGDGKADFEIFVAVGSLAKGDFVL